MSITFSPVNTLAQLHLCTSYPSPDTARVAVFGTVDLATAQVLRDGLLGVLHDEASAVLDVDLAGVDFLDCTGISALVAVHTAAVRTGRQIRVIDPQPIVHRVLDLTGFLGVLAAPVDQPRPLTARSDYPSSVGPTAAAAAQPPAPMVARERGATSPT